MANTCQSWGSPCTSAGRGVPDHCYNLLQSWPSPPPPLPPWTQMAPEDWNSLPSPLGPTCWISLRAFLLSRKRKNPEQVTPFNDHCYLKTSIKSSHNILWFFCVWFLCGLWILSITSFNFFRNQKLTFFHLLFPFLLIFWAFHCSKRVERRHRIREGDKTKIRPFCCLLVCSIIVLFYNVHYRKRSKEFCSDENPLFSGFNFDKIKGLDQMTSSFSS